MTAPESLEKKKKLELSTHKFEALKFYGHKYQLAYNNNNKQQQSEMLRTTETGLIFHHKRQPVPRFHKIIINGIIHEKKRAMESVVQMKMRGRRKDKFWEEIEF